MKKIKVGFVGCGNMGGALARAVSKSKMCDILLADKDTAKANLLASDINATVVQADFIAKNADYIFLGVKPQMMDDLVGEISPILKKRDDRFILVTMAAGIKISRISQISGEKFPTIRIMPNTPVSVGKGMILYSLCSVITDKEEEEFINILQHSGKLDKIDEKLIDVACSISGCGPAFVYMFAESMAKVGKELGLDEDKAVEYAAQTMLGAAKLMLESEKSPETLRKEVCSPNGATIEGVKSLQSSEFDNNINAALKASYKRTLELG